MSRRHDVQDATGVIVSYLPYGVLHVVRSAAPVGGEKGFAPSCIWQNVAGTIGSLVYVNTGTFASASWTNVV